MIIVWEIKRMKINYEVLGIRLDIFLVLFSNKFYKSFFSFGLSSRELHQVEIGRWTKQLEVLTGAVYHPFANPARHHAEDSRTDIQWTAETSENSWVRWRLFGLYLARARTPSLASQALFRARVVRRNPTNKCARASNSATTAVVSPHFA